VPIGLFLNKVTNIGGQAVQFGGGPRYYADSPDGGPHGWGFRAVVVLLFPTGRIAGLHADPQVSYWLAPRHPLRRHVFCRLNRGSLRTAVTG